MSCKIYWKILVLGTQKQLNQSRLISNHQMTTSEQIEIMDGANFQLLANAVLSSDSRDYAAIIETGANSQGQTIKSPLDAFCLVPRSSPPHFVLVEHSTTAPSNNAKGGNLATKWTSDLDKAVARATQLTQQFPTANFTVVLTSSQRPSERLVESIYKQAEDGGVRLDIWEQSRIARFLDTTAEGHYFRKVYLRIEAEMLSTSLLKEMCEQSLEEYERFIDCPTLQIAREEEQRLYDRVKEQLGFHCVIGNSGLGKSTLLWRLGRTFLQQGNYVLWLPAHYLGHRLSLEATIHKRLMDIQPSLLHGSKRIEELIFPKDLMVIVDDPNREENPAQVVGQLFAWMRPTQKQKAENSSSAPVHSSPYIMLCALWPTLWAAHSQNSSECQPTFVGHFNSKDSVELISLRLAQVGLNLVGRDIKELSVSLSNVPFLIGLWGELISSESETPDYAKAQALATDVLEKYITERCHHAALKSPSFCPAADFRSALARFGAYLIKKGELSPTWCRYQQWLQETGGQRDISILSELARQNSLWRLQDDGDLAFAYPVYRHDRLRHLFLVEAVKNRLGNLNAPLDSRTLELCSDPYWAEVVGEAFCRIAPTMTEQTSAWMWEYLRSNNPLALALAYRNLSVGRLRALSRAEQKCQAKLHAELSDWASKEAVQSASTQVQAIGEAFYNVDDSHLSAILKPLSGHWAVGLALLRNGVVSEGALQCILQTWDRADPQREPTLVQGKAVHKQVIVEQLTWWLTRDFADKHQVKCWQGAIALAGSLQLGELIEPLSQAWHKLPQSSQKSYLPLFLWAGLHCFQKGYEDNGQRFLNELLNIWGSLSDEPKEENINMSDRDRIGYRLHHIVFNAWPTVALKFLIAATHSRPELTGSIRTALSRVDSPDVLEFFVRQENHREGEEYATMFLVDHWSDSWRRNRHYLSKESLQRARTLWQDSSLSGRARRLAFRYWGTHPDGDNPQLLSQITADEPYYESALQLRIQRGDLSVVPEVLPMLMEDRLFWWRNAHKIWCPELKQATQELASHIQPQSEHSTDMPDHSDALIRMLRHIPKADAEEILIAHWPRLKHIALFLPLALWIGTPQCLELVKQEIGCFSADAEIFAHLHFTLEIWPAEGEEEKARLQVLAFLSNILP